GSRLQPKDLAGVGNGKQLFHRHVDERWGYLWNEKQGNKGDFCLQCKQQALSSLRAQYLCVLAHI
ncbi:hypothetical protein KUCAC02_027649, partial [Chaenocephalus aceratus]